MEKARVQLRRLVFNGEGLVFSQGSDENLYTAARGGREAPGVGTPLGEPCIAAPLQRTRMVYAERAVCVCDM